MENPSRYLLGFFQWICRSDRLDEIVGDLLEVYDEGKESMPLWKARWRFTVGLLLFFRPDNFAHKTNVNYMLIRNYWHVGWRNLKKYKTYSAINLLGLTVGLVSTWFISLYVLNELSYDRSFSNADRIYRVALDGQMESGDMKSATTSLPAGWFMKQEIPDVEHFATITNANRFQFKVGDETLHEKRTFIATEEFFEIFDFEFIHGDRQEAFKSPNAIVLSENKAIELFGSSDAVGKTIETKSYDGRTVTVTGVIANPSKNSHIRPEIVVRRERGLYKEKRDWADLSFYNYVKLKNVAKVTETQKVLDEFSKKHLTEPFQETFNGTGRFYLQPLTDIHLYSYLSFELEPNGRIENIWIISALGIFILLVVSINYMNLATTRATKRVKEIGIRSMMGSNKKMLRLQYLTESALIIWLSLVLSTILVFLMIPFFNSLSGKSIEPIQLLDWRLMAVFFSVTLFIGLVGGSYPGIFLSRFNTADIFRRKINFGNHHMPLGKVLNGLQFIVALTVIILSVTAYRQLEFMRAYDLGFDQAQVVKVQTGDRMDPKKYETIRTELLKNAGFQEVATAMKAPGEDIYTDGLPFESPDGSFVVQRTDFNLVDEHFADALGLKVLAGRNFGDHNSDQWGDAALINQSLAKSLGYSPEEALGKKVKLPIGKEAKIVGVLKDFHIRGLHTQIEPLAFFNVLWMTTTIMVKVPPHNMDESLSKIDEVMYSVMGHKNHKMSFLDQDYWAQYQEDERQSRIFLICALITILLSVIGLVALASFSVELKMKEITIRKVFGANFSHVVWLFVRQYALIILLAVGIAIPSSIYLGQNWLENFAYRIEVSPMTLIGTSLGLIALIFMIIWVQSKRSFRQNPADQLVVE